MAGQCSIRLVCSTPVGVREGITPFDVGDGLARLVVLNACRRQGGDHKLPHNYNPLVSGAQRLSASGRGSPESAGGLDYFGGCSTPVGVREGITPHGRATAGPSGSAQRLSASG